MTCNISSKKKSRYETLIKRINKHKSSIILFATNPDIEYHNNYAEQQIIPAVIFRKVSFGNRTSNGAKRHSILSSIFQTCNIKYINIKDFLHNSITGNHQQYIYHIETYFRHFIILFR